MNKINLFLITLFIITAIYYRPIINLPMYPSLSDEKQGAVDKALHDIFKILRWS